MKKLLVLALDGMLDSSVAITLDTLRSAEAFAARSKNATRLRVTVAAPRRLVRAGNRLRLDADVTFRELAKRRERPDWVIVPGLGVTSDQTITSRLGDRDVRAAMTVLQDTAPQTQIAAGCSSVFLLGEAGLLDQRRATTTWWLAQQFRTRYPAVRLDELRMLVRDDRYLTAGSAFAQLDLVLAIVRETLGIAVADLCSRYLLIDERPSQARYMIQSHLQHADPTVVAAERWIDANLGDAISIANLASAMAVSQKTLSRRIHAATGASPMKLVHRRRLLRASHLLETTTMTIESIAANVGYQDGTALRKIIRRELGVAPAALRRPQ